MVIIRKPGFRVFRHHGRLVRRPYNYILKSRMTGKPLGYSLTRKGIKRRERQVQTFKHLRK